MDRYKSFFRGIAYAGYCIVFLFAVYTFEKSIPDQIYVKAGEAIDYQFQVPVTMEIQEDSSPVAKSTNSGERYRSCTCGRRCGLCRRDADRHLCEDKRCPRDRYQ